MKKAYRIILIFVVLSLFGILSLRRVPIGFDLEVPSLSLFVSYTWANAAPDAIERQVTTPLEGIFATLRGVKRIESSSRQQYGQIILTLDDTYSQDQARFEVASLVRQLYPHLPVGISYPTIKINNPSQGNQQRPLLSLQLNANDASSNIRSYIENVIKPSLAAIKGIQSIEIFGGESSEWQMTYLNDRISALGISEEEIVNSLKKHALQGNLGFVQSGDGLLQTFTLNQSSNERDLSSIIVKKIGDRIVTLTDVVNIKKGEARPNSIFRINGNNAVQVALIARSGVNQLAIESEIKALLVNINQKLPPTYSLSINDNSTDYIKENIQKILLQSIILISIIIVLTYFMLRKIEIVMLILIGLFATILISNLVFWVLDIEIHIYSLGSVIPAVGLVCGNLFMGLFYINNASYKSMIRSFLSSSVVSFTVLLIIWFLPENIRLDLWDFAKVILVTQIVSLFVCIYLIPALNISFNIISGIRQTKSNFMPSLDRLYWNFISITIRFKPITIFIYCLIFGFPVFLLPERIESNSSPAKYYNSIYKNWYAEELKSSFDFWLGGSLRLFAEDVYTKANYEPLLQTTLFVAVGMPNNSTIEQMDDALRIIEKHLKSYKEIDNFLSQAKTGQQGLITIYFKKPYDFSIFPFQLKGRLMSLSTEMSGIDWNIYGVGKGFNVTSNENETAKFNIILKGYNYTELENITVKLQNKLLTHPRIQDVDIHRVPGKFRQKDLFEYTLLSNASYAVLNDVSANVISKEFSRNDFRQGPDLFQMDPNLYDPVNVYPERKTSFDRGALLAEPIITKDSAQVKMGQFTILRKTKKMPQIEKENQQYIRQISFEYMGSSIYGDKFLDKALKSFYKELPLGYSSEKRDQISWLIQPEQQLGLIGLVIALVFVLGSALFESILQPLTIIGIIPLSFVGIFLGYYWTDTQFDQGGYAAFIFISSIITVPTITIINEFNKRMANGSYSSFNTYQEALRNKVKPVLFFLSSAAISLVPFLCFGTNQPFWYSFAIGSFSGLIGSFFVIWFCLPVFLLKFRNLS